MIRVLLFLNILVSLGISVFLIINFAKSIKEHNLRKIFFSFFLIALGFLLLSTIFSSWLFNISSYNPYDLLFIHSIIIFFEAILLLIIIYSLRKNKRIFYLLFIYLIFIMALFIGLDFSNFLLISSLVLIMILFIILMALPNFRRSSKFAILYSSISLFLQILLLFQNQFSPVVSFISNMFFFIFLFFFLSDIKKLPQIFFERRTLRLMHNHYLFDFLRYFVFIIILTNFIFIGVLAVHEGGHFFISRLTPDCGVNRIVYEGGLPHTEILCNNSITSTNKIIFGGIFFPILIALLLFFGGGTFMKEIALLIIGFNILISYKDFIDLGFSQSISVFFSIFGGIVILLGIGILAKSRTTEEEFIHLEDG
jgi:hypothetical protein